MQGSNMPIAKVLIVEDDSSLVEVLAYNFRQAGYDVAVASDGRDGLRRARLTLPQVVILDLMIPEMDGLEVCRALRADAATQGIRVLMLTAKAEEADQIVGFSMGADDYVTKPFSVKVLLQRVKALCRRGQAATDAVTQVERGGILIDRDRFEAKADGNSLSLTQSEFRILDMLIRQPGRVFSRAELIEVALSKDGVILERTVDVHVRALRQKLGDRATVVETVRGVGYRFRDRDV
ncbi:MAG: response regulator transcription factor [Planctomycetales bacterium]